MIATVIESGKASMADLSTVLNVEALHDLYEMVMVEMHNKRIMRRRQERG